MLADLIRLVELKEIILNGNATEDERIEYDMLMQKLCIRFPKLENQEEYKVLRRTHGNIRNNMFHTRNDSK